MLATNNTRLFTDIISQKYTEEEIIAILLRINQGPISSEIIATATKACLLKMNRPTIAQNLKQQNLIDICGTGGDKLHSYNISTAVAFVLAAGDVMVVKHGNRASSSRSGSADILQFLKISSAVSDNEITNCLEKYNLVFLFAPNFHPNLANIASARKKINTPTIFNYLGPLLNPLQPNKQIIGVNSPLIAKEMALALIKLRPEHHFFLVYGNDSMDELTTTTTSTIIEVKNATISQKIIAPEDFGIARVDIAELKGGEPKHNATALIAVFEGLKNAYYDIITLNSGLGFLLADKVTDLQEGVILARELIDSKKALQKLHQMQNIVTLHKVAGSIPWQ